jgi:hypothetical protein
LDPVSLFFRKKNWTAPKRPFNVWIDGSSQRHFDNDAERGGSSILLTRVKLPLRKRHHDIVGYGAFQRKRDALRIHNHFHLRDVFKIALTQIGAPFGLNLVNRYRRSDILRLHQMDSRKKRG